MRLPKTVTICGKTYTVGQNNRMFDSSGTTITQKITVGTQSKKAERRFENYIHEVMELIACERSVRYGSGVSELSIFVMSHKEFDNYCVDVATAIYPMLKD